MLKFQAAGWNIGAISMAGRYSQWLLKISTADSFYLFKFNIVQWSRHMEEIQIIKHQIREEIAEKFAALSANEIA